MSYDFGVNINQNESRVQSFEKGVENQKVEVVPRILWCNIMSLNNLRHGYHDFLMHYAFISRLGFKQIFTFKSLHNTTNIIIEAPGS